MKERKIMFGVQVLFGAAIVLLISAVFIYTRSENVGSDKYLHQLNLLREDVKEYRKDLGELNNKISELQNQKSEEKEDLKIILAYEQDLGKKIQEIKGATEVLQVRQHTLEKKMLERSAQRSVSLNFPGPLSVELIGQKEKESLLKRSGVLEASKGKK